MGGVLKFMEADDAAEGFSTVLVVLADIDLFEKGATGNIDGIGLKIIEQLFFVHVKNVDHDIGFEVCIHYQVV